MAEYAGIARSSIDYLVEASVQTMMFGVFFGVICAPVLIFFGLADPGAGAIALAGYIGLATYFAHLNIGGNAPRVSETEDTVFARRAMTILLVVYYNLIVLVSVIIAFMLTAIPFDQLGLAIAVLVPFIDGEITRSRAPLSLGGLVLGAVWLLEQIVSLLTFNGSESRFEQGLSDLLEQLTPQELQSVLIYRFEQTLHDWV